MCQFKYPRTSGITVRQFWWWDSSEGTAFQTRVTPRDMYWADLLVNHRQSEGINIRGCVSQIHPSFPSCPLFISYLCQRLGLFFIWTLLRWWEPEIRTFKVAIYISVETFSWFQPLFISVDLRKVDIFSSTVPFASGILSMVLHTN